MSIINLTQHLATPEQLASGVVDLPASQREVLQQLLTFDTPPSAAILIDTARKLAVMAADYQSALIGGAPFLMSHLERHLSLRGIRPLYAFSRRESVEEVQPDGSVRKINVFRHAGFVDGFQPF